MFVGKKTLIVMVCLLMGGFLAIGQTFNEVKARRDAARLALRSSANGEDLRFQPIEVPANSQKEFFSILKSIYSTPDGDELQKCNIHTFPDPSIDYLVVVYQKGIAWSEPLEQGIFDTESETFNELLYDYDLVIEKHVQWNNAQNAITLRSRKPLNIAALANEFYNINGIEEIDLGVPKVTGNDIEVMRTKEGWQVDFILRFGAQLTGNGQSHTWRFQVTPQFSSKLLKEFGDPVPVWMRCEAGDLNTLVRF